MTDTITLPRATVQQALEALEDRFNETNIEWGQKDRAITALKAALEQQQAESVAKYKVTVIDDRHPTGVPLEQWGKKHAEPIGWLDGNDKLAEFMHRDLKAEHDKRGSATPREFTVPVYTAPPQRKPMTKEQRLVIVATAINGHASTREAILWAIEYVERHHGIKEGT